MLEHGGRRRDAARQYGIALDDWLDLSTGINPLGWPVPALPPHCWQRLPQPGDGLEAAASHYYGARPLLAVAGSQAAILALPRLRPACRVGVLAPTYAEHSHAWTNAGHEMVALGAANIDSELDQLDVLLLVNPNNPTGAVFEPAVLRGWQARLAMRGGWLVVDEAFADANPAYSLAAETGKPGLVVLRSLGKFFGLAGARMGFVLAWPALLTALDEILGPWSVNGPAREVARLALLDVAWQESERLHLNRAGSRLDALLGRHGLPPSGGTALFQWVLVEQAPAIQQDLARQGIWVRRFDAPPSLRFGLPGAEAEWRRLDAALGKLIEAN